MKNEPNLPNVACPDSSRESQRREKASVASLGNRHWRLYECTLWTWNRSSASKLYVDAGESLNVFELGWFYSGCANFFDSNKITNSF
ncbi:hypothetical protein ALC53_01020 [Atta colombica]|uniref:Uncharacterized protein n=1 Tax=Atta colombica TaxID=520822 RepID=A0A195BVB2_9HYME|nr:hypothetical protein ALC53_01020 [Atta colombica]